MNVLLSDCPIFGDLPEKRNLPGWKPFQGTGAEEPVRLLCENLRRRGGDGIYVHIPGDDCCMKEIMNR